MSGTVNNGRKVEVQHGNAVVRAGLVGNRLSFAAHPDLRGLAGKTIKVDGADRKVAALMKSSTTKDFMVAILEEEA